MAKAIPKLATIGEVANMFKVPLHRINYILSTRPHIRHRATAGMTRCFDDKAIAQIRHELNLINARCQEGQRDD